MEESFSCSGNLTYYTPRRSSQFKGLMSCKALTQAVQWFKTELSDLR